MSIPVSLGAGGHSVQVRELALPTPVRQAGGGDLMIDYGGMDLAPGAPALDSSVTERLTGVSSVNVAFGLWELGDIVVYDDLPFVLPPLGAETGEFDDSLDTAMPIVTTGPVALVGTLSPADRVDYFKFDGKETLYQLAFGNALPTARGGQRIVLLDQQGRTLHSMVMPPGKGVLTLDLRRLHPSGEPFYIGITRDENAAASSSSGATETEAYWMLVRTPTREGGGSGSSWYDLVTEFSKHDADQEDGESEGEADSETETAEVTVAAEELVTAPAGSGLPTGPLPRLAAGFHRGLLAPGFDVGRVSPAEGVALDLPSQIFDGDAGEPESGGAGSSGPLVAVRGTRFPLLAAADFGSSTTPMPSAVSGENGVGEVVEAADQVAAEEESRPSRRLPAGLGLATVLAVSLLLPDITGIRPGSFFRRRLGLGIGGGPNRTPDSS